MLTLAARFSPLERDVRTRRRAGARQVQLARFRARSIQQIGERAVGRLGTDHQQLRRARQIADRLEARQRVVAELAQMRVDDELGRRDQQRVAVGRRACRRFGADGVAGAGPVLDHQCLPLRAADLVGEQPCQRVGAAAGGRRHDDLDGACRLGRRGRDAQRARDTGSRDSTE
jgi:hypothetical protein